MILPLSSPPPCMHFRQECCVEQDRPVPCCEVEADGEQQCAKAGIPSYTDGYI